MPVVVVPLVNPSNCRSISRYMYLLDHVVIVLNPLKPQLCQGRLKSKSMLHSDIERSLSTLMTHLVRLRETDLFTPKSKYYISTVTICHFAMSNVFDKNIHPVFPSATKFVR